jgi:hypothetical protein
MPNQDQIWLPSMQRWEVYLRADFRYGPDDPTLWPQPWVIQYPHLSAIPRKPEDPNDPLSIMWWDPTRDDFESLDGSLVDGLGELSRSKSLVFETMMKELESRIEEYKMTSVRPNNLLLSMLKAMQDACTRLGLLKTTFTEMRFGITKFQCYYLEVRGLIDYLELYKPRMDGQKPAAITVTNCIGAFMNIARIVQNFHTAGLPIWFLRPQKVWMTGTAICNILEVVAPLIPTDILCTAQYDPPFSPIFRGLMISYAKHDAIHGYSQMWLVFKDLFQGESSKCW